MVAEDLLHLKQIHTGLDQMGGIGMAEGILTLLMNRSLFKFTTDIIRTTASPLTSSAVCDDRTMKRSS